MRYTIAQVAFALGANALVARDSSQCVQLKASGGASGVLGQLSDGQNRVGGNLPTGCYCLGNGGFTDSNGRGCILTPPTTQFQCDVGASPTTGFSIGSNGQVEYNGSGTFYACPATTTGQYNVYSQPVSGQDKCVKIELSSAGACGSSAQQSSAPAPAYSMASPMPQSSKPAPKPSAPASKPAPQPSASAPKPSPKPSTMQMKPAPSPVPESEMAPSPSPCPESEMAPQPSPYPESEMAPPPSTMQTKPAPQPSPVPESKPAPQPSAPAPKPAPQSSPAPAPAPAPAPSSAPAPAPAPAPSPAPAPAPAPAPKPAPSNACPADLNGAYQYPHLIVPVNSASPDQAYGTSYFGKVDSTTCSIFNFDIPASYSGKTCTLTFLFPKQADLQTSSFTESGSGQVSFTQLMSPATQGTTYANQPGKGASLGSFDVAPGNSYTVASGACAAGQTVSYEMCSSGGYALNYFQDYNPSPIGLYIREC